MLKVRGIKAMPPKGTKFRQFEFKEDYESYEFGGSVKLTESCCGVLEIGDIPEHDFINDLLKESIEIKENWGYSTPAYTSKITFEEAVGAFKRWMKNNQHRVGMMVCYLLPSQHKGDFGKLIKACGWTYHGSFFNPKTRRTLHHWGVVIKKRQPRVSKKNSIVASRR